jgi:hypothetical protein
MKHNNNIYVPNLYTNCPNAYAKSQENSEELKIISTWIEWGNYEKGPFG